MSEDEFRTYLKERKATPEQVERAIDAANDFESYLSINGTSMQDADLTLLERYVSRLIEEGRNSEDRLVDIARYCRFAKKNDFFIHIAGLVNGREVLLGIRDRVGALEGETLQSKVFEGFELPPAGAPQQAYIALT